MSKNKTNFLGLIHPLRRTLDRPNIAWLLNPVEVVLWMVPRMPSALFIVQFTSCSLCGVQGHGVQTRGDPVAARGACQQESGGA